jgi:histidine ammonia-lyase
MGCNAALMTKKVIDNSFEVLSIQMMTVLQAIDYLGCEAKLSTETLNVYTQIRKIFPKFIEDMPKYKDLEKIKKHFEQSEPVISFKLGTIPSSLTN